MTVDISCFHSAFSVGEFQRRRQRLYDLLGDGIAVLQGLPASGAMDLFRQHNDFFYLCGVETPHACLVLNGQAKTCTLYLPPRDKRLAEMEGPGLDAEEPDEAIRMTGVDEVRPLAVLGDDLRRAHEIFVCRQGAEGRQACQDSLRDARRMADNDPWRTSSSPESAFAETLRRRLDPIELRDLSPLISQLRRCKSPSEIDFMRRAGEITALAVREAMRSTQPGLVESQLAAVADYVYLLNGASGPGYRPIVASGDNIWYMHYFRNHSFLAEGDLVLMDYAPDYRYYTSDIGRMWPVGGAYQPWQRELYGFVVDYHLGWLERLAPDKTPRQVREEVAASLRSRVSKTRWSRPQFAEAVETLLTSSRAATHSVGMAVHDESGYQDDDRPLEPGFVFALDPQLWVRELRLYIRVEDTVVITDTGVENLTRSAPHDLDAVEELMAEPGIIQQRPDLLLTRLTSGALT